MRTLLRCPKGCRWLPAALCLVVGIALFLRSPKVAWGGDEWYKGQTHAHTRWSDGDELPETVIDWYKSHGYHFLAISDHDYLMKGENWKTIEKTGRFSPTPAEVERCQKRFGPDWVVLRGEGENRQIRLKTFDELSATFNEPGRFLLIENEEITALTFGGSQVHINAVNLGECISPEHRATVLETLDVNLAAVKQQAERLHRPILTHVNHPNWDKYYISAEDLAQASAARFVEVCNGHPGSHHDGDQTHPGTEKLWDIANTIRLARMKAPPLYATAGDDAHDYQGNSSLWGHAYPGRAWIMVRAARLNADALIDAMNRGDFYASTGVKLRSVVYKAEQRTITVEVQSEPNVQYTIEFIGTIKGTDSDSSEVGKILSSVQGTSAIYTLTGQELYVRAVVRSDRPTEHPPAGEVQKQEAWCQPLGWKEQSVR